MIKDLIRAHRRTLLICITISFALYMVAAWRSAIYLHPDEYYQIVEFASYKMHITMPDQMAWEYGEKIRPAFQPLMCFSLLKAFNVIHISDHYTQLYLLRVLSGLLSLSCIALFCVSSLPVISERYRKAYIIGSCLFWYPYTYGVHFSSETWAGCAMLIAMSLAAFYYLGEIKKSKLFFVVLGLLMGAAFLLRFQTAFISAGILAWMLFEKKESTNLFWVIGGGIAMLAVGSIADHWLYGEWLFTPWRYFDAAFVHKHTEFGSKPFYFYPLFFVLMLTPPIGILIVTALIISAFTQTRSLYVWALLPFLLFHCIVGHKEFRFMYPVIATFPLMVMLAYQGLKQRGVQLPRWIISATKWSVVAFNILGLIVFVFFANYFLFDSKIFCHDIHDMAENEKNVAIYYKEINNSPYVLPKATIPKDLYPEYMRDKNVNEIMVSDFNMIGNSSTDTLKLIATNKYEYMHPAPKLPGHMIARTLVDLSFVRSIAGDDSYKGIEENTYLLIENMQR